MHPVFCHLLNFYTFNKILKMPKIQHATVDSKISQGYNFDFGRYISEGFSLFGKDIGQFVLFTFIAVLIMCVSIITIIGPNVVMICMLCGYASAAEKIENGQKVELNDFFRGFENLGNKIVLGLIYFGLTLILYIPYIGSLISAGLFSNGYNDSLAGLSVVGMMLSYFFMYVGMLLMQAALVFTPYLVHFGDYSATQAVKKSFQLYKKNFLMITIFVLIMLILSYIGVIFCLVGIFASIPILGTSYYAMIKDTLMTGEFSEIDQIGNLNA